MERDEMDRSEKPECGGGPQFLANVEKLIDATPGGTLWTVGTVYRYPQQRTLIARKLP